MTPVKGDLGDGPLCPEPGEHGKLYFIDGDRLWCPVTQSIFASPVYESDGLHPGAMLRDGTQKEGENEPN